MDELAASQDQPVVIGTVRRKLGIQGHALSLGLEPSIVRYEPQNLEQIEIVLARASIAFQPGQRQQFAHQRVEMPGLPVDPVKRCLDAAGIAAQQVRRQPHPRQRRPQFVGDVVEQAVSRPDQFLKPFCHGIEISGKVGDLVLAATHCRPEPDALVVGGIGVMNIMLVSVTERTREIGVRMAVGARQSDILQQFLIEAVLVCLIGGAVGVLLALMLGLVIRLTGGGFEMVFSLPSILLAFACSTGIGILFGFLPARNAARLNPVDALSRD